MASTNFARSATEALTPPVRCPCLSGETYDDCCGRLHRGEADAPTAERLMRARFSAFAVGDAAYLVRTWHPSTRPERGQLELDSSIRWYRLDVLGTTGGGLLDRAGTVHFRAYFRGASKGVQEENSSFVREGGRWFYVDGLS